MITVNFLGTPDDPVWFVDVVVGGARYRANLGKISAEIADAENFPADLWAALDARKRRTLIAVGKALIGHK